jgi:hypothetical protein
MAALERGSQFDVKMAPDDLNQAMITIFARAGQAPSIGKSRFRSTARQASRVSFPRPQFVEEAAFLKSIEEAPIDEVLWLYFFRPRVDFGGLIDDRLERFSFEFQPRLQHFYFFVVGGVQ